MIPARAFLRARIRQARARGATWERLLRTIRLASTPAGRSVIWTKALHGREVHQTTSYTCDERYPELFDLAATLSPGASRILSFGCSTGEELVSLRRRFPEAEIVGAEINPRSRRIARNRLATDRKAEVVDPRRLAGTFDLIFALAVLQREPHRVAEAGTRDLSSFYPFERFDAAVRDLARRLRPGGYFCIANAQYRLEDSSVAAEFQAIPGSSQALESVFGPDGHLLVDGVVHTIFRKASGTSH